MKSQYSDLPTLPTLDQFLYSINLSQYIGNFRQHNVEMEQLLTLNENDYEYIGITSFGHKRLLSVSVQQFIASVQNVFQENQKAESKRLTIHFLYGYTIFAVIVGMIIQFTVKEKLLTGYGLFDVLLIAAGLCAFLSPSIIAWWRGHPYKWAILLGNIFLGGTGLGWVVCFVFSLSKINPAAAAVLAFLSTRQKR